MTANRSRSSLPRWGDHRSDSASSFHWLVAPSTFHQDFFRAAKVVASLAIAGIVTATPITAFASPARVDLDWGAPAQCPELADVVSSVESYRAEQSRGPLAARAHVERTDDGRWTTTLEIEGAAARRLVAMDCDELGRMVAMVVALALDSAAPPQSEAEVSSDEETPEE